MDSQALKLFIEKSQNFLNCGNVNFQNNFTELSQQQLPTEVFGKRKKIHDADYRLLLYSWFMESICDFEKLSVTTDKARIWSWVDYGLNSHFPNQNIDTNLVNIMTEELYQKFVLTEKRRGAWKHSVKEELLKREDNPKCWICKRPFSDEAINNFISSNKCKINLPKSVDFMFPRGLKESDLSIQIEHIVPFSLAGSDPDNIDNLDLSCGWCNLAKSNTVSIYTRNRNGNYYDHPSLGKMSIPNRYWVVKLLMNHRECQVCGKRPQIHGNELRPVLINDKGVANINNLKVVCGQCDPIKGDRIVNASTYKDLITRKKSNLV